MSPLLFSIFFAAEVPVLVLGFSGDPVFVRDMVHREEYLGENRVKVDHRTWAILS